MGISEFILYLIGIVVAVYVLCSIINKGMMKDEELIGEDPIDDRTVSAVPGESNTQESADIRNVSVRIDNNGCNVHDINTGEGVEPENKRIMEENKNKREWYTQELLIETLRNMGCRPSKEEDGDIYVEYQGAGFSIEADEVSPFATFRFLFWYEFSSYNIDAFSTMQKIVNNANCALNISVFYTINKDSDTVYIHSSKRVLFIPQIPKIDNYMHSVFRELFYSRQYVSNALDRVLYDDFSDEND